MTGKIIVFTALVLGAILSPFATARAEETTIGVNVINPYALGAAEQDAMLEGIHAAGVPVIRASITLDDKGVEYAERPGSTASGSSG